MSTRSSRRSAAGCADSSTLNPATIPLLARARLIDELQARGLSTAGARNALSDRLYDYVINNGTSTPQIPEEAQDVEIEEIDPKDTPKNIRGSKRKTVTKVVKDQMAGDSVEIESGISPSPYKRGRRSTVTRTSETQESPSPVRTKGSRSRKSVSFSEQDVSSVGTTSSPQRGRTRVSTSKPESALTEEFVNADDARKVRRRAQTLHPPVINTKDSILGSAHRDVSQRKAGGADASNSIPTSVLNIDDLKDHVEPTRVSRSRVKTTLTGAEIAHQGSSKNLTPRRNKRSTECLEDRNVENPVESIAQEDASDDEAPLISYKSTKVHDEELYINRQSVEHTDGDEEQMPSLEAELCVSNEPGRIKQEPLVSSVKQSEPVSALVPEPSEASPSEGRPKRRRIARIIATPPPDEPRRRRSRVTRDATPPIEESYTEEITEEPPLSSTRFSMEDVFDTGTASTEREQIKGEPDTEEVKTQKMSPVKYAARHSTESPISMIDDIITVDVIVPTERMENVKSERKPCREDDFGMKSKNKKVERVRIEKRKSISEKASVKPISDKPSSKQTVIKQWQAKVAEMKIKKEKEAQASSLSPISTSKPSPGSNAPKSSKAAMNSSSKNEKRVSSSLTSNQCDSPVAKKVFAAGSTAKLAKPDTSEDVLNSIFSQQTQFHRVWEVKARENDAVKTPEKRRERNLEEQRQKEHESRLELLLPRAIPQPTQDDVSSHIDVLPPPPPRPSTANSRASSYSNKSTPTLSPRSTPSEHKTSADWNVLLPPPPPPKVRKPILSTPTQQLFSHHGGVAHPRQISPEDTIYASHSPQKHYAHQSTSYLPPPPPPRIRSKENSAHTTPIHSLPLFVNTHPERSTTDNSSHAVSAPSTGSSLSDDVFSTLKMLKEQKDVEECVIALVLCVDESLGLRSPSISNNDIPSAVSNVEGNAEIEETSTTILANLSTTELMQVVIDDEPLTAPKCTPPPSPHLSECSTAQDSLSIDEDSSRDSNQSCELIGKPSSSTSSPEKENANESSDGKERSDKTEDILKDPAKMSKILKKANDLLSNLKRDIDQQDQGDRTYSQMEPEEGYEIMQPEKPLPEFHGEPVPSDDGEALFEAGAGLPRRSAKKKVVEIEEELLPSNDVIELDYYNADLHIKCDVEKPHIINPENADGLGLMWGGVKTTYGLPLPYGDFPKKVESKGNDSCRSWEHCIQNTVEYMDQSEIGNDPNSTVVGKETDTSEQDMHVDSLTHSAEPELDPSRPRKLAFQIKILEFLSTAHIPFDELDPHDVRIGFSLRSSSTLLGESSYSWCFTSLGKKATNCAFVEYGDPFHRGDVVTAVVDLNMGEIGFWVNDKFLGTAFDKIYLPDGETLYPHICSKNCKIAVNLGNYPDNDETWITNPDWTFPSELSIHSLERGKIAPASKENCTVLMMVGMPGVGKTTWVRHYLRDHPEENWTLISPDTILNSMKVNGHARYRVHRGRWDMIMGLAAKSMNRYIALACRRRRNYIIDGTNVGKDSRRRKLMNFKDFQRKCVVIIPSDDEWQSRLQRQARQDSSAIMPIECMLELKATLSIPNPDVETIEDIHFIEPPANRLQEAVELVQRYNEEARPWYQSRGNRGGRYRRRGGVRRGGDGDRFNDSRHSFERRDSWGDSRRNSETNSQNNSAQHSPALPTAAPIQILTQQPVVPYVPMQSSPHTQRRSSACPPALNSPFCVPSVGSPLSNPSTSTTPTPLQDKNETSEKAFVSTSKGVKQLTLPVRPCSPNNILIPDMSPSCNSPVVTQRSSALSVETTSPAVAARSSNVVVNSPIPSFSSPATSTIYSAFPAVATPLQNTNQSSRKTPPMLEEYPSNQPMQSLSTSLAQVPQMMPVQSIMQQVHQSATISQPPVFYRPGHQQASPHVHHQMPMQHHVSAMTSQMPPPPMVLPPLNMPPPPPQMMMQQGMHNQMHMQGPLPSIHNIQLGPSGSNNMQMNQHQPNMPMGQQQQGYYPQQGMMDFSMPPPNWGPY